MTLNELTVDGLFCDGDWIEKKDQDPNGAVRLIQLMDIGEGEFKDKSQRFITEKKAMELHCTFLEKGDILVARLPDPLGRACIFPLSGKYITAVDIAIVRIKNPQICVPYVMHMINSSMFRRQIKKFETGTTRKRISRRNLEKITFDLPTFAEQQRVVTHIEELFSELDKAVETLQTTKVQLTAYRQAVLKEAFVGHEKWGKYQFSDLMSVVRNGYGAKPDDRGGHRILRISSVRPMKLNLEDYRLNRSEFLIEDTIRENDLLFTRYNGSKEYVGVCASVPILPCAYAYPDKLIKCTPKLQNQVHSKFLQYYMNQGKARKYLRSKIKTTSGQNGISGSDIKKTIVFLPDMTVQKAVVAEIESRLSVCDSIEQTVDTALQQAEAMRQSILKQAFEGMLV